MPLEIEIPRLNIHIASHLIGADEFPIPVYWVNEKQISVEFDYPLSRSAIVTYHSENGFTLENLIDRACKTYQEIYDEDQRTTTNPEDFDGGKPYGIWGHALDELWIEGISLRDGIVALDIGSRPSPFWILGSFNYLAVSPVTCSRSLALKGASKSCNRHKPPALIWGC